MMIPLLELKNVCYRFNHVMMCCGYIYSTSGQVKISTSGQVLFSKMTINLYEWESAEKISFGAPCVNIENCFHFPMAVIQL